MQLCCTFLLGEDIETELKVISNYSLYSSPPDINVCIFYIIFQISLLKLSCESHTLDGSGEAGKRPSELGNRLQRM